MSTVAWSRRTVTLVVLTTVNVVIQLVTAGFIKYSTGQTVSWILLGIYAIVLTLNFGRFVVWGYIHRQFPLGIAYASSALLFPAILALSYYYGEPVSWRNVLGVCCVMLGVIALVRDV